MGHDREGFRLHPENFIEMPSWDGKDTSDRVLEDAIDFLEQTAFSRAQDLRPLIAEQKDAISKTGNLFPLSYDALNREAFERARQARLSMKEARASSAWFSTLFGGVAQAISPLTKQADPTYDERKSQRRALRRKEYARVKELMQKALEVEQEKERAFYAQQAQQFSLWNLIGFGSTKKTDEAAASEVTPAPTQQ